MRSRWSYVMGLGYAVRYAGCLQNLARGKRRLKLEAEAEALYQEAPASSSWLCVLRPLRSMPQILEGTTWPM